MELQSVVRELRLAIRDMDERITETKDSLTAFTSRVGDSVLDLRLWHNERLDDLEVKMKAVEEAVAYLERYEEKMIAAVSRIDARRKELDARVDELEKRLTCDHEWTIHETGSMVFSEGVVSDDIETWYVCTKCGLALPDYVRTPVADENIPFT